MIVIKSSIALAVVLACTCAPAHASMKTAMQKSALYVLDGVTYPVRKTSLNVAKFLVEKDLQFENWLLKTAQKIESAEIEEIKTKIQEAQPEGEADSNNKES